MKLKEVPGLLPKKRDYYCNKEVYNSAVKLLGDRELWDYLELDRQEIAGIIFSKTSYLRTATVWDIVDSIIAKRSEIIRVRK